MKRLCLVALLLIGQFALAQTLTGVEYIKANYQKYEYKIPMRDGVKLHTHVYVPKDASEASLYPFMMERTCYDVSPYGPDSYPRSLGPSGLGLREKYIFVEQDVRGRYMSEGLWTNMTPHLPNKSKPTDVDEASDTYDTIEWLLKNVKFNNGKVGQAGISYPGFYAAAGTLCGHPALKASSPQAPVGDFFFDDFHHNGAFTQGYIMTFPVFGVTPKQPTPSAWFNGDMIKANSKDGYQWNMEIGSLKNMDKYYKDNFFWQETIEHPNYDEFWKKRGLIQHLKNVKHAVMTVGGWFDAEDIYGPMNVYRAIEKNSPANTYNTLVMGPYGHGRWSRPEPGVNLHSNVYFGDSINTFYQTQIEAKFFRHFLKEAGDGKTGLPEAYCFDTGAKKWRTFDKYPANTKKMNFYLVENGTLANEAPKTTGFSEYVSDPMKPVPSSDNWSEMLNFTPHNYMSEDQRFASRRTDVLSFQTGILENDLTLGGEIMAKLKVATTGTDADFFVKVIDVYPADEPDHKYMPNKNIHLGGYQQMVRSEIMRARFRNSFEKPEPLVANQTTDVNFRIQDMLHTFKKGHRLMIQVQSTAFPLFDRNPQKYVPNIYKAEDSDFQKATHRIFNTSSIEIGVVE